MTTLTKEQRAALAAPALLELAAQATTGTPEWTAALCAQVDPEQWFPEKGESNRVPRWLCGRCPIQADCLAWAIATDERYGVWGGSTPAERLAARRLMTGRPAVAVSGGGEQR